MSRPPRPLLLVPLVLTVGAFVLKPAAAGPVEAPCSTAEPTSIGDPYFPCDGNAGIDVGHYEIHDSYAFGTGELTGTTTLTLTPTAALASFSLDLLLDVTSVTVGGAAASYEKPNAHELVVTPAAPLPAGVPVEVTVEYGGAPGDLGWDGEWSWRESDGEVITMNEPHMAPWWFPSNDHPSDKATFDIAITTAASKEVVSNGELVGRSEDGKRATTRWRMDAPMTTYLAFFAAGDFAVEEGRTAGIPWYNAVSKDLSRATIRSSMRLLRSSGPITAWLEDELGEYPFRDAGGIGGVVTALDVGFALENQTRPTYGPWLYKRIVVHEIAHQWFGNSVSLRRWRDIWLNEGFATYMEARWDEAHGGQTTRAWLRSVYALVRDERRFWSVDLADPDPDDLFHSAVYNRGALALAALRNVVGKGDFRRVLRRWVARNAHDVATLPEFRALAERVSGEELDRFFRAWLRQDSAPPATARYGL